MNADTTTSTVAQLRAFASEAALAGDQAAAELAEAALAGDLEALAEVGEMLADAAAAAE